MRPATAFPRLIAGLNVHLRTASSDTASKTPAGVERSTVAPVTWPSAAYSAINTTLPEMRDLAASTG